MKNNNGRKRRKTKAMTDYLKKCLDYLEKEWQEKEFTPQDVFPYILRGAYNLARLEKLGKLKSRIEIEGDAPLLWPRKYYSLK